MNSINSKSVVLAGVCVSLFHATPALADPPSVAAPPPCVARASGFALESRLTLGVAGSVLTRSGTEGTLFAGYKIGGVVLGCAFRPS